MKNKNILSIAIILIAVAIIFVNLNNPFKSSESTQNEEASAEEVDTSLSEEVAVAGTSQVQEGKPAPDFELKTLDGKTARLSDYKGKKVILNFWATWCPPCQAEMPHMQKFYENNKDKGIEILAVNLTSMDKGIEDINAFKEEFGLTFPIPLDEEGNIGEQYQAFTIPTSYIVDSKGIIRKKVVGPMDEEVMTRLTKEIE